MRFPSVKRYPEHNARFLHRGGDFLGVSRRADFLAAGARITGGA
jgi:hypothetical protein